jgi:3',5'-cyclic AMP phosphodiesterase CpdA
MDEAKDMTDTVRILHFTDMHLRWHQPGTANQPERLSRQIPAVLERLAALLPELAPDVLAVTGDLLDVPDEVIAGEVAPEALATARQQAEADYRLVREWLIGTGIPYVALPGNHDIEDLFHQVFTEARPLQDIAGLRFVSFYDRLNGERAPERLGESLARFETVLTDPAHDAPQVHLQHYTIEPPTTANNLRYNYIDSDKFSAAIERSGRVRATLSGHYHPGTLVTGTLATGAGEVHYSVVPGFCSKPHPFRLVDIAPDGGTAIHDAAVDEA